MKIALASILTVISTIFLWMFFRPHTLYVQHATVGAEIPESTSHASAATQEGSDARGPSLPESSDAPPQAPLPLKPQFVRGIYLTNWSAGSANKMRSVYDLLDGTDLNAVVIDIKDYSGFLAYRTDVAEAERVGAHKELRIMTPNSLIKELHEKGIYVIGRISVFQDQVLARAHPEWALKNASSGEVWKDNKGLMWLDTSDEKVWQYTVQIAKDALARGFDEVNFDYIRFASDGNLNAITYPSWDEREPMKEVVRRFFKYLRAELSGARISADIFGIATIDKDDLGIGQIIEYAYENFDYVSPMIYPSHFHNGFIGYANPAAHPYDVISYAMGQAFARLTAYNDQLMTASTTPLGAEPLVMGRQLSVKLRPWLQDFDLGADYDAEKVRAQIRATTDAASSTPEALDGWLLWNPSNVYTREALPMPL